MNQAEDTPDPAQEGIALLQLERDSAARQLRTLQEEIAFERRNPWTVMSYFLAYRLLSRLSRFSPPIPRKVAMRFARSALKKSPDRSLASREVVNADLNAKEQVGDEHSGRIPRDAQKKNILVVSHDASISGAPILVLNLLESLRHKYNVTVLSLGGGDMLESFRSASVAVYVADRANYTTEKARQFAFGQIISRICSGQSFAFAVVNSAESRSALRYLQKEGVVTVSLIHEFAAYVRHGRRKKSPFEEIFEGSTEVVFSTRLTRDAAQLQNPQVNMSKAYVLAQGKCHVPRDMGSLKESDAEKAWLQSVLRPNFMEKNRLVVIGAGTVIFRKGVDLFIEVATKVLNMPGGENAYFYWIGANYLPDTDVDYSTYLQDQLLRAGIEERVTMLRQTPEIELAYSLADIFVLSSRLDPLPNVTLDAMSAGLPVVCFDRASGTVDFLAEAGLKDACVANYIDTHDLSLKVHALATNSALRAEVSARTKSYAQAAFDFDSYARKIEDLALGTTAR